MYDLADQQPQYFQESQGFQEFFQPNPSQAVSFSKADFSSIGLPYETWANDPEWQELATLGIGPIEAVQLAQPEYAETAPEALTEMLREQAWDMDSHDQAEFWKFVKKAAGRVAKVAAKVVKPLAVAGGTAVGTFFGAPAIGAKIGGALGGLASRGLTKLSKPGGFKKAGKEIRRNVNRVQTRVRRGQPVFTNQQVSGALAQLRALLANPQIAALVGQRESYAGHGTGGWETDIYGEADEDEDAVYDLIGGILEAAGSLEDALEAESYDCGFDDSYTDSHNAPQVWAD